MKNRVFTVLGVLALGLTTVVQAQEYDDIYGSSAPKVKKVVVKTNGATAVVRGASVTPVSNGAASVASYSDNNDWDVDSYNRRGAEYEASLSSINDSVEEENSTFANTQRIERFYNPDIIVKSNDEELLELYFDNTPSVNLIVGSTTYLPVYTGVYSSWYSWCNPFYDPFYFDWVRPWGWRGPWYYSSWGWHHSWYYSSWGWHHPWHYNPWGWHGGWNYHHHWGHTNWRHTAGWDRPGHHSYYSGLRTLDRRPSSRLNTTFGNNRVGVNNGTRRVGVGSQGGNGVRNGMNNGRTRPEVSGGMNNGRRPSAGIGNLNGVNGTRSVRDINSRTVTPRNDVSRTPATRSNERVATERVATERRSYDGGSRSFGGGGSNHSTGGFGGGNRGGGGFSGGGSHGGGGGGGGRRH